MMSVLTRKARIIANTYASPSHGVRHYRVVCACGRLNKFHRWSWFTTGASRCRGCWEFILAPTSTAPLEVIHHSWLPVEWPELPFGDKVAAVTTAIAEWQTAPILIDGEWAI